MLEILDILSDENRLQLFLSEGQVTNLSRKQYYGGLHQLKKAGLIQRNGVREYEITSAGLIIKEAIKFIEHAIKLEKKLQAYDTCRTQYKNIPADHWAEKLFDGKGDGPILDLLLTKRALIETETITYQ